MKERLLEFDFIKGCLIILVVWGHLFQITPQPLSSPIYVWIYSFHMPLFIFISGYFSTNQYKAGVSIFFIKKIKHLIVPNITCAISYVLIVTILGLLSIKHISYNPVKIFTDFWFLWEVLACSTILYCCKHISRRFGTYIGILLVPNLFYFIIYNPPMMFQAISLPFFVTMLPYMYPAYLLGLVFKEKQDLIKFHQKLLTITSIILYTLIFIYCILKTYTIQDIKVTLRLTFYLCGCVTFYYIMYYASTKLSLQTSIISNIGKKTLGIYIIQHILIYWIIDNLNLTLTNCNILVFIISLILTIMIYYLLIKINLYKYSKYFFG